MTFKIKQNVKCRALQLVVDPVRLNRHMEIIRDFYDRGYDTPSGLSGGPEFKDGERIGTKLIFSLSEEVADEYIARMRRPPTKAEKEAAAR
ncbi:hypothetical protein [Rhizobium sp. BK176]|uniref:hypothetical protein n=1 Tax=Rhizobium sp. BK176 TaxID=2587071 RepID=UPI002169D27C|nr:hypothetical protein [Rhizobium sp. BK176]MCS4089001.1 hypothetical protein [Rhizobium sp. BK176]